MFSRQRLWNQEMTEKGMRLNKGLIEPSENDRTDGERLQVSVKGILTFVAPLDDIIY